MPKSAIRRYIRQLLVALLILLVSTALFRLRHVTTESEQYVQRFQRAMIQQEDWVERHLQEFVSSCRETDGKILHDPQYLEQLKNTYRRDGLVFVIYEDGQPVFWSHNALPLHGRAPPEFDNGMTRKANGWYYYQAFSEDEASPDTEAGDSEDLRVLRQYVVFYTVKQDFKYQNQYLVNQFHHALPGLEAKFFLSDRADEGHRITDRDGNYLFSLVLRREEVLTQPVGVLQFLSVLFGTLSLLVFVFFSFRYFSRMFRIGKKTLALGGFSAVIILLRVISFYWQLPGALYDGVMFSPELYATSEILPSLGDLFMHVAMVTIIAYFLYHNLKDFTVKYPRSPWLSRALSFLLFLVIYLFCGLSLYLIEGLVINSHLNLDVNFIFNLDMYSLVGFLIIGLIFFAFFFLSVVLCRVITGLLNTHRQFWIMCAVSFGALIGLTWIVSGASPILWSLTIVAVLVFEIDRKNKTPEKNFAGLIISVFLFSLISTFALDRFNTEKDIEKRKNLVLQLASEQDPVAEFLFMEIEEALFNDSQLQNLILRDPYNDPLIENYLQYHYFYDFWEKYNLQVTVCHPEDLLTLKPENVDVDCLPFFGDYINAFGKQTISEQLIYLDNNTGTNSYIVQVPIRMGEEYEEEYHLFIEFDAKFIARDLGFPELLIDDAVDINRELINYSYATYRNGNLVNEYGTYHYSVDASVYDVALHEYQQDEFAEFSFDDYSHLMYHKDDETLLIISRPKGSFLESVAPFSYLFITFFFIVVVFWLLISRNKPSRLLKINFRRRLQYSMVLMLLISALTIGGASAWFIFNIYENKNLSFLNEKAQSVLIEVEHVLADESSLEPHMEFYLYDVLLQYSNIFFTDINLYNPDGQLLASSRPKIFEEGIVGRKMNTLAFLKMKNEQRSQFIHSERIGKLEYLSAYTPLYNRYNEKLGYLNLPYFARESELRNEMSYFLVAFINIYLLLVVVAVVVAIFVSNYVTRPLQLIRNNLARLKLGKTNEKIDWDREDEIGSLVREYNRMIDELAVSAELLARSERETAWREMARQVAHEIKNPLTPMKLSVQYLEKAWKEKVPDWDERLERFSKTMIEQIDNMAVIAKEFSDFAQMPAGKNGHINLREFIPEVLDMYKDFEKVDITLEMPAGTDPMQVYADRNQLLRVFNNLIKNAIQSYDKHDQARILVECNAGENEYHISVTDYGSGIPDNLQQEIFTPYFTTKAKGMGLGLSMVKSIIESFNGSVSFTSREGEGSTFMVSLPATQRM